MCAVNGREDELVELLRLAVGALDEAQLRRLLTQHAHGSFFQVPPSGTTEAP